MGLEFGASFVDSIRDLLFDFFDILNISGMKKIFPFRVSLGNPESKKLEYRR